MPAGFAQRFIAYFVDGLILGLLYSALWLMVALVVGGVSSGSEDSVLGFLLGAMLVVVIPLVMCLQLLYFGYFWSKDGQTIGMKTMKIKVQKRDGSPVSFVSGALRGTVGYFISSLIFDLGFIWAAFDADQEAWHDKLFDTHVVLA